MTNRLGKHQRRLLASFGVGSLLVTPDRLSATLVMRGLLREEEPGGSCCITPAGLRALADMMECGDVEDAIEAWARKRAESEAKAAANA